MGWCGWGGLGFRVEGLGSNGLGFRVQRRCIDVCRHAIRVVTVSYSVYVLRCGASDWRPYFYKHVIPLILGNPEP